MTTGARTAVLSLVGALCLSLYTPLSHAAESDDLWAEALLLSSCGTNTTVLEAETLLLNALHKAEAKAPIYVSLGDYYAGAAPMRQAVQSSSNHLGELAEAMTGHESQSLRYYLAAVHEDQDCVVAWYRIAMTPSANDKLRKQALANCTKRDGDNALPYYFEAYERLAAEQQAIALSLVQKGNRKTLRIPRSPMPDQFSLKFPDKESYQEAGVVGMSVSPAVFIMYARANDMFPSMSGSIQLHNLARDLVKHAKTLNSEGKPEESVRSLEAVATLGLNLVRHYEDGALSLLGVFIAKSATQELRPLYVAAKDTQAIARLDEFKKARKSYVEKYKAFLESAPYAFETDVQVLKNLHEVEKRQAAEENFVATLLKKTGLDTFSFEE